MDILRRFRRPDLRGAKFIVGLGNPGPKYAHHRHNVGFQCLDRLAQVYGLRFQRRQAKAILANGEISGVKVALVKPLTYVNLSGEAVGTLAYSYGIPLADILVIHDDLDLPLGMIRLRAGGSSGGHKGVRSIIEHLGSQDFPRLRIGIGRPVDGDVVSYVLSDFTPEEKTIMEDAYRRAVAAVECFLTQGIVAAMNRYNRRDLAPHDLSSRHVLSAT